jgi:hypothetical protein
VWTGLISLRIGNSDASSNIRVIKSKRMRCEWYVACVVFMRSGNKIFMGKPEGKSPLGRPMRGWENNIRMDLTEIGRETRSFAIRIAATWGPKRNWWDNIKMASMKIVCVRGNE